ncbi:hypothetical protein ACFDR9_005615, partial [Janthinobacterium sp. CG_23.3]|uniref:hypothetical protein n=1 Tax=Janthinobacterium sp. CG_23.3 TaxID=3349634 RepID=UPI0038D36F6A
TGRALPHWHVKLFIVFRSTFKEKFLTWVDCPRGAGSAAPFSHSNDWIGKKSAHRQLHSNESASSNVSFNYAYISLQRPVVSPYTDN